TRGRSPRGEAACGGPPPDPGSDDVQVFESLEARHEDTATPVLSRRNLTQGTVRSVVVVVLLPEIQLSLRVLDAEKPMLRQATTPRRAAGRRASDQLVPRRVRTRPTRLPPGSREGDASAGDGQALRPQAAALSEVEPQDFLYGKWFESPPCRH